MSRAGPGECVAMSKVKAVLVLSLALATGLAPGTSAETRKEVPAKEFDRGGKWRFWFGDGYRKAWTTPVVLPVLDLKTEAGGLTPLRQVGGLQTEGLAMKGADGQRLHLPQAGEAPRAVPAQGVAGERSEGDRHRPDRGGPPRGHRDRRLARPVGGDPVLRVAPGGDAGRPGARESSARPSAARSGPSTSTWRPGYEAITEIVSTLDLWKKWREGGPAEPRRQPGVPEGAALRSRRSGTGTATRPVALGARRGPAALGAAARGRRPGVHALRGQGDRRRRATGPALHALLGRVPEADRGADHQQRRRDPLVSGRRRVAGLRGGRARARGRR